jgi:hypothetical protein
VTFTEWQYGLLRVMAAVTACNQVHTLGDEPWPRGRSHGPARGAPHPGVLGEPTNVVIPGKERGRRMDYHYREREL